jgi:single-stranded-DNA-specific exonuclease
LLNALESCAGLFTRYGGHAHAVGFSLPATNLPELRTRLDDYARARLTLADFEPTLTFDAELALHQVNSELFNLLQRLEPFGVGNPQPVFAARSVRLMASPRIMKDKHVKLKVAPAVGSLLRGPDKDAPDLAILTTPRCDPDSAALRRTEVREATHNRQETDSKWHQNITFDALGWHMAERCQQAGLLPGDALDIAFTIDNNDHPEYGGLELSLRDFTPPEKAADKTSTAEQKKIAAGL